MRGCTHRGDVAAARGRARPPQERFLVLGGFHVAHAFVDVVEHVADV